MSIFYLPLKRLAKPIEKIVFISNTDFGYPLMLNHKLLGCQLQPGSVSSQSLMTVLIFEAPPLLDFN